MPPTIPNVSCHFPGQQLEGPARAALRGIGARRGNQQRLFLTGELSSASGPGFFAQRQLKVAFHEATLGSIHRRPADPTVVAITASVTPVSAASKICAR